MAQLWLQIHGVDIPDRSEEIPGHHSATDIFAETVSTLGRTTSSMEFTAIDWADGRAELSVGNAKSHVRVSPDSLYSEVVAELIECSTLFRWKSWFSDSMADQDISHTPKDNIRIVTSHRWVEIAPTLKDFLSR